MFRRLALPVVISAAVIFSACSESEGSENTSESTNSSAVAPETPLDVEYIEVGPENVGVTTLALPNGDGVEVWYPTEVVATGQVSYDVRDFVPESLKALLTAEIPASYSIDATRDADVKAGKYPVVLFSHGFSGMRLQSSFLTSHLASWGMIVISPDHAVRDLKHAFVGQTGDPKQAVTDLFDALAATTADARFTDVMDQTQIATLGHSAGGGTALMAAADDRIIGYVSMASGSLGGSDAAAPAMPDKPSFFIAGTLDEVVSPTEVTQVAFEKAPSPSIYWLVDGVGHNGFDDFCTFGDGKGIIGVAEASGLGPILDTQPQFRKLGSDGCLPPAVSSEIGFPIIRQAVTAWLVDLFGTSLDTTRILEVESGQYGAEVTITAK